MSIIRKALAFSILMTFANMVMAGDYVPLEKRLSIEQQRETGLDTLTAGQIEKLNAILAGLETTVTPTQKPVASRVTAPMPAERPLLGFNEKPILGRLKGTLTGWEEGSIFELENGQQWKVLKGRMELPKSLTNPPIKLVPGIAGRWFLQVCEDYPMARVYLIN